MIDFAITLNPDPNPQKTIKAVQVAEELGFTTCYVADQGFTMDVYVTLASLIHNTKKIRLGPGVTHPYTRHPVVTAVSVASLDQLSGGRVFLGIGAGGSRTLVPMQIPRSKPLQLTREMAEIARLLWQGSPVTYVSEFHPLSNASLGFPCRPDIEIHWAGRGPKMLELGGELADVNLLFGIPHFELPNAAATTRKGIARSGRPAKFNLSINLVYDASSREIARAKTVYRLVDSTDEMKEKLGLTAEKIDLIRKLVTTTGPKSAAYLMTDEMMRHFIIEGDTATCADRIRNLITDLGLTGVTVEVPEPANCEKLLSFAADVLSRI